MALLVALSWTGTAYSTPDGATIQGDYSTLSSRQLIDKAWQAVKEEHYDSAQTYYTVVASRYSPSATHKEIEMAATASVNVGYLWMSWRMNGEEAYPWLRRAYKMASRHDLPDVEIGVNSNLGQIYFNYGNIPKSLIYLQKALNVVVDRKRDLYFTMCLMELAVVAVVYDRDKELNSTLRIIEGHHIPPDTPQGIYAAVLIKSMRRYASKEAAGAASLLDGAEPLLDMDTDRIRYLVMHHLIAGRMFRAAGDFARANLHFKQSMATAAQAGYHNLVEKSCIALSESYIEAGHPDSAAYCQTKVMQIRDSLFSVAKFEAVKDSAISGQLSDLQESVQSAELKAHYHRRISTISIVAGILLAGVAVWLAISLVKLNSAYRNLFRRNMDIVRTETGITSSCAEAEDSGSSPTSGDPDPESVEILRKVRNVMECSAEIYDASFSIENLGAMIGVHPRSVSKAINRLTSDSFSVMLANYRIKEACRRLSDVERLRTVKIESVAEEVGYRSRTHFSKVFKSVTGLTPTQFLSRVKASKQDKSK